MRFAVPAPGAFTRRKVKLSGSGPVCACAAFNAGSHVGPTFGGDTVYAWSEVLAKEDLGQIGALRFRLVALKNQNAAAFPLKNEAGEYDPNVVLDFDYWAAIPKR